MGSNNAGPQSYTTYIVEEQQMMTDVEAALSMGTHSLTSTSSAPSLISGQVINLATAAPSSVGVSSSSSSGGMAQAAAGVAPLHHHQHRVVVVVNSTGTPVGTALLDGSGRMVAINTDGLAPGGTDGGLPAIVNMAVPACNNNNQQQQPQQQILLVQEDNSSNTTVTVTGDNTALTPGTILSASNSIVINGEYAPEPYDLPGYKAPPTDPPGYKVNPTDPPGYKAALADTYGSGLLDHRVGPVQKAKRYSRPAAAKPGARTVGVSSLSQRRRSTPATAPLPPYPLTTPNPQFNSAALNPYGITNPNYTSTDPPGEGGRKDTQGEGDKKELRGIPHHGMDELPHQHHLTRTQVEGLFMILGPHYSNPGRRAPLKDFVLASLVLLSTKDSYREMSEQMVFKSRGWMHKTIHLFCNLMVKHLSCLIEWPSGDAVKDTIHHFQDIAGIPGVIGAMGTCHMAITKAPVGKSSSFYSNPMQFHSIHLLGVSDHRSRFTYINVGRPGSLHESKVYEGSSLCQIIENESHVIFPPNTHIIAGPAFPLHDRILIPYPNTSNPNLAVQIPRIQREFSTRLQHTRRPLEVAFQLLRSKWQRLKCLEMQHVTSMSIAIKTCCILHNICMHNGEYKAMSDAPAEDEADKFAEVEHAGLQPPAAVQKRDLIAHHVEREAMVS